MLCMRKSFRKRTAAAVILLIFLLSGALTASAEESAEDEAANYGGVIIPIFMYHEVKPYNARKDVITPYEIESDLKYLKENHYHTINMTELIDYVKKGKALPENPVILTFDDGYLNNYYYVFPLLKKYDSKIVLSIIGKNTDDFTERPDDNLDYSHLTWSQINEMVSSGLVEIQNHTYDMHKITRKRYGCQKRRTESLSEYEQALTEDIGRLQEEIKAQTGISPNTFTYPYGQVSRESYPIIKKIGFQASLTCRYGVNIITKDPEKLYGLRRVCRAHSVPIQKALRNVMKTLKYRRL